MLIKKLFLASSRELEEDRKEFEIFINRKNKDWVVKGVFLELLVWEDFLDAVSKTRLQDEYNKENSWLIVAPLRSNDETSEQARTGQR
jgi:hypothetical protein